MPDYTLPQAKKAAGLTPTNIEWTDFAFNPLRAVTKDGKAGWACQKVAAGCANCYAESLNKRWGTGLPFTPAGMRDVRVVLDESRVAAALSAKPRGPFRSPDGRPKVFVCDMTDLFGEWVPFETIDRLFALFALRPDIDWQVLTKRPERMAEYLGEINDERRHEINNIANSISEPPDNDFAYNQPWPLPNVFLGCSASTQADLDANVPHLLRCPAAVRFLSLEPLVGQIEFSDVTRRSDAVSQLGKKSLAGIHWVIVGGESGRNARPCNVECIRSVVRQCGEVNVPCFVKQDSGRMPGMQGRIPNDLWVKEWPHGARS